MGTRFGVFKEKLFSQIHCYTLTPDLVYKAAPMTEQDTFSYLQNLCCFYFKIKAWILQNEQYKQDRFHLFI